MGTDNNGSTGGNPGLTVDAVKVIDSSIKKLGDNLAQTIDEFQKAEAEKRTELLTKISHLEGQIEGLKAAAVSRPGLNGVQVTKTGEKEKFSFGRFFKMVAGVVKPDDKEVGYEAEVCKNMEMQYDRLPLEMKTAINAATDSGGAFLIPQEVQDQIIPELEAMEINQQLGVTTLNGLVGNISWVVDDGGITAVYVNTEEEETGAESVPTYSMFELRPHVVAGFVPVTFIMLQQSAIALDSWVTSRLASKLGLREDLSVFLGDSASSEPRGILNHAGIGSVDFNNPAIDFVGSDATIPIDLRAMILTLAQANVVFSSAPGFSKLGWAASPEAAFGIASTVDADGKNLFQGPNEAIMSSLMGLPLQFSTQLTNNAGTPTDERLLLGDYSQCVLGRWGTIAFASSDETETNFRKMRRTIRAVMAHDVALTHQEAFVEALNLDVTGRI